MFKKLFVGLTLLLAVNTCVQLSALAAEPWKGRQLTTQFNLGLLQGYSNSHGLSGYAIVPTASVRILEKGFVPDINNSVHAEIEIGPFFASGQSAMIFGSHLRWDFTKDDRWTFYALAGLGGNTVNINNVGTTNLFPRFGAGAIYGVHDMFSVRAEVSHELTAVGLMVYL